MSALIDFIAFSKKVHANAVQHGWYDNDVEFGCISSMIHAELSESLEEYRSSKPLLYKCCELHGPYGECTSEDCNLYNDGKCGFLKDKPEGIAVELVDCLLRILDWFGYCGCDYADKIYELSANRAFDKDIVEHYAVDSFPNFIAMQHYYIAKAFMEDTQKYYYSRNLNLMVCFHQISHWLSVNYGPNWVDEVLELKYQFNINRPYRHNNKKC